MIQLPVFDIFHFIIHTNVAFVPGSRDDPLLHRVQYAASLLTQVIAGIEFAGAEIILKLGKSKFQIILADQLKSLDIHR